MTLGLLAPALRTRLPPFGGGFEALATVSLGAFAPLGAGPARTGPLCARTAAARTLAARTLAARTLAEGRARAEGRPEVVVPLHCSLLTGFPA